MKQSQSWLMRNAPTIIVVAASIVSIDVYAGATGAVDPYPVFGFPLFAALRGGVLTLSITYTLSKVRALLKAGKRDSRILPILGVLTLALLASETAIIAPYIVARIVGKDMAQMLLGYGVVGQVLLTLWSVTVALVSTLSVASAAVSTFVEDAAAALSTKSAAQKSVEEKPTAYVCEICGTVYEKQQSFAAHRRHCARSNGNGHGETIIPETIAA